MLLLRLLLLVSPTTATTFAPNPDNPPCGFRIGPCPQSMSCSASDPSCPLTRGENCAGRCVPTTLATPTTSDTDNPATCLEGYPTATSTAVPVPSYEPCGGDRKEGPLKCKEGYVCVDDPRAEGCGMACDGFGVCVEKRACGGYFGTPCPVGLICVEDPSDGCDPELGAVDCNGVCV